MIWILSFLKGGISLISRHPTIAFVAVLFIIIGLYKSLYSIQVAKNEKLENKISQVEIVSKNATETVTEIKEVVKVVEVIKEKQVAQKSATVAKVTKAKSTLDAQTVQVVNSEFQSRLDEIEGAIK